MAGQRSVSAAELKAECINLERDVLRRSLATEEFLEQHRPGKEKNTARDARGWLRYYAVLQRTHARGEEGPGVDEQRARADGMVLDALRDAPIRVDLLQPVPFGPDNEPTDHLFILQKSLDALLHAHGLDRQLAWLLIQKDRVEAAGAQGMPGSSGLHEKVIDAISYTYGLLAWIMTSPGPETAAQMPYEVGNGKSDPELPLYIKSLHPLDVAQIANASSKHHARLAALQILIDRRAKPDGRRPSWSQFVGSLAVEMGTDSVQISKLRSLGSLLAAVQLDSDAKTPEDSPAYAKRPAAGTL